MEIPLIVLISLLIARGCMSSKAEPNKYSIMARNMRAAAVKDSSAEVIRSEPTRTIEAGHIRGILSLLSETMEHKHEEIFSRAINLGSGVAISQYNRSSNLRAYFELETQIRGLTTIFELTHGEWKLVNHIVKYFFLTENITDKLEENHKFSEIASEIYYNFEQRDDFLAELMRERNHVNLRLGTLAPGIRSEVDSIIAHLTNDSEGPSMKTSFLSTAKPETYDQILERLSPSESFLPESILHSQLAMQHNKTLATLVGPNYIDISPIDTYDTIWAKVDKLLKSVKTRVTDREIKTLKRAVNKRPRGQLLARSQ